MEVIIIRVGDVKLNHFCCIKYKQYIIIITKSVLTQALLKMKHSCEYYKRFILTIVVFMELGS